jgi:hypothetical protein
LVRVKRRVDKKGVMWCRWWMGSKVWVEERSGRLSAVGYRSEEKEEGRE